MIITCPNCQARYQVTSQTIGNAGRKVQCANCQTNWKAEPEPEPAPEPDKMFDAAGEQALDDEFRREEDQAGKTDETKTQVSGEAAPGENGPEADAGFDAEKLARQKKDLDRRKSLLNRALPEAWFKRIARMVLGIVLLSVLGGSYTLRQNIVTAFPDLAGLYGAIGIKVNVIGLEFRQLRTLRALRDGAEVMEISASITNVSKNQVAVPVVLVSLLDEQGRGVYEWSSDPQVVGMQAGEWIEFKTQLTSPPAEAVSVRLSFVVNSH